MSKRTNTESSKRVGKRRKEAIPTPLLSITELSPSEECNFKLLQQVRNGLEKVPLSELTSMMKGGTPITVNSENSIYSALMVPILLLFKLNTIFIGSTSKFNSISTCNKRKYSRVYWICRCS